MAELILSDEFQARLAKVLDDSKNEYKHENYQKAVDHAEELSWHVYGTRPEKLLKRTRPREDPAITTYRLESYEPTTKAVCKKALDVVHKIFDANLYSIIFPEGTEADKLKVYSREEYPRFNDIVYYVANFGLKKMIADPNGIFLVQPFKYDLKGFEYTNPIVTCYKSKDIWLYDDEYFLLFDAKEKSKSIDGGDVWKFTYVTKNSIYKLAVEKRRNNNANRDDVTVMVESEYVTNFDDLPLWQLGGEYSETSYGLLESFFAAAVPFWNKAINGESDLDGHFIKHMWPQQWAVVDECEYVEEGKYPCQFGYIFNASLEKGQKHQCPSCKGTGRKRADSPYEFHAVNREKFDGENDKISVPGIGYLDVPTGPTELLSERVEMQKKQGLKALNMDIVDEIGLNQSGVAKEMDRTELNQFLQKIADTCFEIHLKNIYYYFTLFMFGVQKKNDKAALAKIEPQISKPTQFDIYSTAELTESFTKSKEAKLNPSYLKVKQAEIQNREFQTNPALLKRLNLELSLDPLAEVNTDEITAMLADGTITKNTAIVHANISAFVGRAIEEDQGFYEKKYPEKVAIMEGYAEEVEEENKAKIDTTAIEQNPNDTGSTGGKN